MIDRLETLLAPLSTGLHGLEASLRIIEALCHAQIGSLRQQEKSQTTQAPEPLQR